LSGTAGGAVDRRDEASVSGFFETLGGFDHLVITAGDWGGTMFAATRELDLAAARDGPAAPPALVKAFDLFALAT
jgi:hypothetical protein